jgi:hypothetical protein
MAAIQIGVARPLENKVVLIDPSGRVAFSYLKSRPASPEAAIMVRGDGHIPVVATELGRIASAFCFEADFPEFVRQIGRGPYGSMDCTGQRLEGDQAHPFRDGRVPGNRERVIHVAGDKFGVFGCS